MKNYIFSLLMMAGMLMNVACSSDSDNGDEPTKADILNYDWGTSKQDIQTALQGYSTNTNGQNIYVTSFIKNCILSYEFDENALNSMALVGPDSLFTKNDIKGYTSGYEELGNVNPDVTVYTNASKNRILEIQTVSRNGKKYRALGWTKIR